MSRLNHHFVRLVNGLLYVVAIVLMLAGLVAMAGLLTSCATTAYVPATRTDSLLAEAGLPTNVRKVKITGPLIIQQGTGNTATLTGKDKTGQRAQAVSTGASSPVTATEKKGTLPWWVFGMVAVGGAIGWGYLRRQTDGRL